MHAMSLGPGTPIVQFKATVKPPPPGSFQLVVQGLFDAPAVPPPSKPPSAAAATAATRIVRWPVICTRKRTTLCPSFQGPRPPILRAAAAYLSRRLGAWGGNRVNRFA